MYKKYFYLKNQHTKVVLLENKISHDFQKMNYNKGLEELRFNDSVRLVMHLKLD